MKHLFIQGSNPAQPVLLLLHGTGGNERDLLPLAKEIDPFASVLSVRGNVLENGMPRFFRRLADGIFDIEDLVFRTGELARFLDEAAEKYHFNRHKIVAIGYSNGANIAGSLLFHFEAVLKGAILLHPMVPRRDVDVPNQSDVPVFIGAGRNDQMCVPQESQDLNSLLVQAGADVHLFWSNYGHQITMEEVAAAKAWYSEHFRN